MEYICAAMSNLFIFVFLVKDFNAEQPNTNGLNWQLNMFLLCATNGFICNIYATAAIAKNLN